LLLGAAAVRVLPTSLYLSAALGEAMSTFFMNQNRDPFGALPLTFIVEGSADPQSPGYKVDVRTPSDSIVFRFHASAFLKDTIKDSSVITRNRGPVTHKIFTYFIRPYFGCCFAFQVRGNLMILMIHAPVI
jgi:hypothetical protein